MQISFAVRAVLAAALLSFLAAVPANAQATRTWVSGVGDDANPCSRTAPCKTFAGAISKTAAGGTISVLDPGGYGSMTITKAISIQTDPGMGSLLTTATAGIVINAGPEDDVFINGLIIDGAGTASRGVQFLAGRSLTMRNCAIRGITNAPGVAIDIATTAGATVVMISECLLTDNLTGVMVQRSKPGRSNVALDHVVIDGNTDAGILADGATAKVLISNSTVSNSAPGLEARSGGKIFSMGNNAIVLNSPNGSPTNSVSPK